MLKRITTVTALALSVLAQTNPVTALPIAVTTADVLIVRSLPRGKAVDRIPEGTGVGVVNMKQGWARIAYLPDQTDEQARSGWVSLHYLKSIRNNTGGQTGVGATVVASRLVVRDKPQGKPISSLPRFSPVHVIELRRGWARISYIPHAPDFQISQGWVKADFLSSRERKPHTEVGETVTTADILRVRESPEGKIIDRLLQGTSVTVEQEKNGWTLVLYVRTGKRTSLRRGWVATSHLQTLDPN